MVGIHYDTRYIYRHVSLDSYEEIQRFATKIRKITLRNFIVIMSKNYNMTVPIYRTVDSRPQIPTLFRSNKTEKVKLSTLWNLFNEKKISL